MIKRFVITQCLYFVVSLIRLNQSPGHGRIVVEIAEYFVAHLVNTNHRVFSRHAIPIAVSSAGSDWQLASVSGVANRALAIKTPYFLAVIIAGETGSTVVARVGCNATVDLCGATSVALLIVFLHEKNKW